MEKKQEETLRRTISRSEKIAHWGGLAVIAGLALETILVCLEQRPWCEKAPPIIADVLIALGVFAELHFGRTASDAREALQLDAEERVANANLLAQEARERAAKIEKIYGWRRVSRHSREILVKSIREIQPPLIVKIEHQSGDAEAHLYANDIGQVFFEAGITNISLTPNSYPFQSKYGLFAAYSTEIDSTQIIDAFAACGMPITCNQKDLTQPTMLVKGVVPNFYLYVGMKPWPSSLENITDSSDEQSPAY